MTCAPGWGKYWFRTHIHIELPHAGCEHDHYRQLLEQMPVAEVDQQQWTTGRVSGFSTSTVRSVDIFLFLPPATIRAVPVHSAVVSCCFVSMHGWELLNPPPITAYFPLQCGLPPTRVKKLLMTTEGQNSTRLFGSRDQLAVLIV